MLSVGKLDRKIMEELRIKRSQYYEYKSKLFQQSGELFDRLTDQNRDSLIYHKELLSERLTRLYRRAELDLTQNTLIKGSNNRASAMPLGALSPSIQLSWEMLPLSNATFEINPF
jgi:hypothetical protein